MLPGEGVGGVKGNFLSQNDAALETFYFDHAGYFTQKEKALPRDCVWRYRMQKKTMMMMVMIAKQGSSRIISAMTENRLVMSLLLTMLDTTITDSP
jgi:hypothetical protein